MPGKWTVSKVRHEYNVSLDCCPWYHIPHLCCMYLLRLRLRDHMTTMIPSFAIRCNHFGLQLQLSELNANDLQETSMCRSPLSGIRIEAESFGPYPRGEDLIWLLPRFHGSHGYWQVAQGMQANGSLYLLLSNPLLSQSSTVRDRKRISASMQLAATTNRLIG